MRRRNFWAVVETFSASSFDANLALETASFPIYHPQYRAPRQIIHGQRIRKTLSLFPGYTFALVRTSRDWRELCRIDDVKKVHRSANFERDGNRFVEALKACEDERGYIDVDKLVHHRAELETFAPGDVVRGLYGLWGDQVGQFVEYDEDGNARVRFSILGGRELVAHVDAHELVAA